MQTHNIAHCRNQPMKTAAVTECRRVNGALANGESVKISSFGTFSIRDKNARVGRNPKTGEEAPIPPRRVLSFKPSHLMKDRVAQGNQS